MPKRDNSDDDSSSSNAGKLFLEEGARRPPSGPLFADRTSEPALFRAATPLHPERDSDAIPPEDSEETEPGEEGPAEQSAAGVTAAAKRPRPSRRWLLIFPVLLGLFLGLTTCFFTSPDPLSGALRDGIEARLESQYAEIEQRALSGGFTSRDRLLMRLTYSAAIYGGFVEDEAGSVLSHYLSGDGSELRLRSSAIRTRPWLEAYWISQPPGTYELTVSAAQDRLLHQTFPSFEFKIWDTAEHRQFRMKRSVLYPQPGTGGSDEFTKGRMSFRVPRGLVWTVGSCRAFPLVAEWRLTTAKLEALRAQTAKP